MLPGEGRRVSDQWTKLLEALGEDWATLPDIAQVVRLVLRLLLAAFLGGLLGFEREEKGKAAGLRTHMLVALGAALFVLAGQEYEMTLADLSRLLQGILTGVGFIGAGAILKMTEEAQVRGLTTAATIWVAAAVGSAAGLGKSALATLATVLALVILALLPFVERRWRVTIASKTHRKTRARSKPLGGLHSLARAIPCAL